MLGVYVMQMYGRIDDGFKVRVREVEAFSPDIMRWPESGSTKRGSANLGKASTFLETGTRIVVGR